MKIVIPMAGKGSRFKDVGCNEPKPLIEVAGRPMFCWPVECAKKAAGVKDSDFIFILRQEHVDEFKIDAEVKKYVPGSQIIVRNDFHGAAQTVSLAIDYIDPEEELFITDCDQYFIFSKFKSVRREALKNGYAGIIGTYDSQNPGYSYAEVDKNGFVIRTKEKDPISRHAAVGVYYFTKAKYFMQAVKHMMDNSLMTKNEYYVCPVYNFALAYGKVIISDADYWMTMGTPQEKEEFEKYLLSKKK